MAAPIGPGDWVECVPAPGYRGELSKSAIRIQGTYPRPGSVHQVREVGTYFTSAGPTDGLRLVGLVVSYPGHPDCWFNADCFRPIYRPKAELIQSLLAPSPSLTPEDA